jgi:polyisoprenoid-binding protein YceI
MTVLSPNPRGRASLMIVALTLAATGVVAQEIKITPERSQIRFVSKQMNVPVEGRFKAFGGSVTFDPAKPAATKATFEVELGSIDMNSTEGETEAKRKPWFHVDMFPKARFVADSVKALGPDKFEATGKLTIKGISQVVVAPFTVVTKGKDRSAEGSFTLKRLAFNIGEGVWKDTETVADDVIVRFRFAM